MKLLITDNGISEPVARTTIVWLAGEFHPLLVDAAPDILRVLSIGFAEEGADTRMQILNLAIKLSLLLPDDDKVQLLATYVLEMARYDPDTDVRDRSRLMTALMGLAPSTADSDGNDESAVDEDALAVLSEHAAKIILAVKLPPVTVVTDVDPDCSSNFYVGSLSSVVNHNAVGYIHIEAWAEVAVPSMRDGIDGSGTDSSLPGQHHPTAGGGSSHQDYDIRKFYEGEEESSSGSRSSPDSRGSEGSDASDDDDYSSAESSDELVDSAGNDSSSSDSSDEDSSDDDSSIDRSVPSPGARKTPTRSAASIQSNSNSNLTQATTASSSIYLTGSRSVVSTGGVKKVVKSSVASSFRTAASKASIQGSVDLLSVETLHIAPASNESRPFHGPIDLIGSLDGPDLLQGWTTGNYSQGSAMNSMQGSAMNSMQGSAMNSMQGGAMNSMQGSAMNSMQGSAMNSMQGSAMNSMQGSAMNSMQGSAMNSMQGSAMNSMQGSATNSMQGSAMNSMQGSAMNSMQGSAMNSMQGSAMNSMQGFKPGQGVNIVAFNPASQGVMAASLHPSGAAPYVDSLPIIDSMSAPKLVLKPEMSGGLKVSLCFRRSSLHYATTSSSASDVFQAVLSVTNCRESPIRYVVYNATYPTAYFTSFQ